MITWIVLPVYAAAAILNLVIWCIGGDMRNGSITVLFVAVSFYELACRNYRKIIAQHHCPPPIKLDDLFLMQEREWARRGSTQLTLHDVPEGSHRRWES